MRDTEKVEKKAVHSWNNLSFEEHNILHNLNKDTIGIKPMFKGGATVIQDTDDYMQEVRRQLEDNTF